MIIDDQLVYTLSRDLLLILAYALLGGGMKYVDQAFDIDVFNKKFATFLSIPGGILMGILMVYNESSATIFLALVMAVALTRKVDNIAFQVGAVSLILVPIVFRDLIKIQWVPFGLLVLSGLFDEYGNDWADKKLKKRLAREANGKTIKRTPANWIIEFFFMRRFTMKLMILLLVLTGFFQPIYFIAFLAFDTAYTIVEKISTSKKLYSLTKPRTHLYHN